jgi:fructose-bisphosphate aldolase class II
MDAMRRWARENGRDIKFATTVFKREIDAIAADHVQQIADMAYREAMEFLVAFQSAGSATRLAARLSGPACGS